MSEELARYVAKLDQRISALEQTLGEHRHYRDPQWDIWTRKVNHYGRTEWTDHFRSGVNTPGFAWQGAPFGGAPGGAGGTLEYSYRGTYMRVRADATPHFYAANVGSYSGKWFVARMDTGNGTIIGIRADDGTNNNYAEFYLNPQNDSTVQPTFTYVTGGGAPVTHANPSVRSDLPHVLLLWWNPGMPGFAGYTSRESGRWDGSGFDATGAIGWVPTRIGLIFRNNLGFYACCDLIYNEYV